MAIGVFGTKCILVAVSFAVFLAGLADDVDATSAKLHGFVAESVGSTLEEGRVVVYANEDMVLRLFGEGWSPSTRVSFTTNAGMKGGDCNDLRSTDVFPIHADSITETTALVTVSLPRSLKSEDDENVKQPYLFCLKGDDVAVNSSAEADDGDAWIFQGDEDWLKLYAQNKPEKKTLLPIWLQSILIGLLLCFSGLFSGLNLGLMSLDKTDLQILSNSGSPREKRYAKTISPVRKRGNFLLCTILLGNVLVNNTLAILMDDLTGSGLVAVVGATLGIVVFGEIIPQAVCSRYGLAVGAHTIWFTRFFMIITFPLSFPISVILDKILGEEIGNVYNRDRLRELIKVTETQIDLIRDEVQIITGALELSKKTVKDIMTRLEDTYMLDYESVLDFETMSEIMKTGYTRIPVFEKERSNIVAILNIKDLAFIDPDDRTLLRSVCKFYNHPVNFVYDDTRLDVMLEEFKKGHFHMSFVQCVNDTGPGDPYYETLGVVTLEDVIEEIIQSEIVDETDTIIDNKSKKRRAADNKDFTVFKGDSDNTHIRMSPQLTLAAFQYLSTTVNAFKPELISGNVLQRLLKQNVLMEVRFKEKTMKDSQLYTRGKAVDYFVLILEGRVEVSIGKENMIFEGGPFMYFGEQALTAGTPDKQLSLPSIAGSSDNIYARPVKYIPDFNVSALTNLLYLRIRRTHYLAACRATQMERQPKSSPDEEEDPFSKEWKRATSVDPDHNKVYENSSRSSKDTLVSPGDGNVPDARTRSQTQESMDFDRSADAGTPLMISSCETMPETKSEAKS